MAENIEIKARVRDWEGLRKKVETICDGSGEVLEQEDTFFEVQQGRLKLRVFGDGKGELIYYEREDIAGPKRSVYQIIPVKDASKIKALFGKELGIHGVVRKTRTVFLKNNVRIHLDDVDGLGKFVEIEVVMGDGNMANEGERIVRKYLNRLEIHDDSLIKTAYIDLIST